VDAEGGVGCLGEVAFGFDVDKAVEYVKGCQTYEGAFALCPGLEAHGGSTYCAVCILLFFLEAHGG
jgi:prenyltransferase beta subunit